MEKNPTSEDPLLEYHLEKLQRSIDAAADPISPDQALEISQNALAVRLCFPTEHLSGMDRDRVLRMHWEAATKMHSNDPTVELYRHHTLLRANKLLRYLWTLNCSSEPKAA